MAGDGSIIIETRLDTGGLEKGLEKLKQLVENSSEKAKKSLGELFDGLGISTGGSSISKGAQKLVSTAVEIIRDKAAELGSAVSQATESAADRIWDSEAEFRRGGEGLIEAVTAGFASGKGELSAEAGKAATDASDSMRLDGEFSAVGLNLMSALRAGLAAGAAALYAKAAEIANRVTSVVKGVLQIHSPSAVFRDEIGKMLMLGLRDGILNNSEAVLEATEALAEDMLESERRYIEEKQRIDRLNDQEDEARRVKEYEKRLSLAKTLEEKNELIEEERLRLRKRADKQYLEQLEDAAEKEREIIEGLKDDITSMYKEMADYIESSLEPIEENRAKLEDKLKKYAEENNSGVVKVSIQNSGAEKEDFSDYYGLADQRKSIETLMRYSAAINAVTDRIESAFGPETAKDFIATLAEMDVEEGAMFAETLASAAAEDFIRYIEDWGTKNTLAEEISRQLYGDSFTEAVDEATEYMRTELERLGLEVPEGFFASGSLSAQEFGRGFSEGINQVLENARELIQSFGSFSGEVIGGGVASVVNNNNYYSTYSVNGTKSTAAESIFAIEAAAAMNRYRGLN